MDDMSLFFSGLNRQKKESMTWIWDAGNVLKGIFHANRHEISNLIDI